MLLNLKPVRLCLSSIALVALLGSSSSAQTPATASGGSQPQGEGTGRGNPGTLTLQGGQAGEVQQAPRSSAAGGRPTLTAVRAEQAPTIDGRLDDAIWRNAALIDTFVQEEPLEGAPATERTEVRVAYDSDQLYFGIRVYYSDMSLMRTNRSDRDKLDNDDTVTVYLEPFLDYLRGYAFAVNGYGVQRDSMVVVQNAQSTASGELSFNVLYYSGGQLVEDGWTAEMAIPFKSLRYPGKGAGETHRWGFQVRREIKSKDEKVVWSPVSRNNSNFLGQIGQLTGMTDLSVQRNFELLPTFTAVNTGVLNTSTGEFGTDNATDAGIGAKYGITSNLTFDFTYNPDFSQIESDTQQIEINQRFPLNYPELRPFFLEGREIYEIPGRPQPVQTRKIVDPRYGAKLTGKVAQRWSVGMFVADDEAPGKVDDIASPAYGQRAQNVLGRVKYDLYRNSHVGVIFTDREFLNDFSRLIMTDTGLRLGETGNFGWRFYKSSQEEASIPKQGWATEMSIRRNSRNINWAVIANAISPEFGNALSFVQRTDQIQIMAPQFSYQWYPEGLIRNWSAGYNMPRLYDFDSHELLEANYQPNVRFQFARNVRVDASVLRQMESYRGIDFWKTRWNLSGNVNTSRKILFSYGVSDGDQIRFVANPFLGRLLDYNVSATFRPTSRLDSRLQIDVNRFTDPVEQRQEFHVRILRSSTTYQFTPRLLVRNILELNTGAGSNHTLFENILLTYRVNSGTVFYFGYDDRFKEANAINAQLFSDPAYKRTNRAIFTKLQYLFRSGGGGGE
ncbi:MAG TPA: DUF5916 domain-containing protein [Vicinamibacterales bacterium]|jgi:hypothetical protein|nr:DUF5916 domain-containing protein [Vicinamibacterales bacterium]